jgi:hypothetical protein
LNNDFIEVDEALGYKQGKKRIIGTAHIASIKQDDERWATVILAKRFTCSYPGQGVAVETDREGR